MICTKDERFVVGGTGGVVNDHFLNSCAVIGKSGIKSQSKNLLKSCLCLQKR